MITLKVLIHKKQELRFRDSQLWLTNERVYILMFTNRCLKTIYLRFFTVYRPEKSQNQYDVVFCGTTPKPKPKIFKPKCQQIPSLKTYCKGGSNDFWTKFPKK